MSRVADAAPRQVPAWSADPVSINDYIDQVLRWVPDSRQREAIELDLRSRLTGGWQPVDSPRDVAESYLASVPLESGSIFKRAIAALIDIPSVFATGIALFYFSWQLTGRSDQSFIAAIVSGNRAAVVLGFASLFVMSPLYYVVSESMFSRTVGKALLGLRVVRESGARITVGQAFIRQIPLFFSFYLLDAAFALFTEKKQKAFELISKTRVVRA